MYIRRTRISPRIARIYSGGVFAVCIHMSERDHNDTTTIRKKREKKIYTISNTLFSLYIHHVHNKPSRVEKYIERIVIYRMDKNKTNSHSVAACEFKSESPSLPSCTYHEAGMCLDKLVHSSLMIFPFSSSITEQFYLSCI